MNFFTQKNVSDIVGMLARYRAREAAKTHRARNNGEENTKVSIVEGLLPPRRQWSRPRSRKKTMRIKANEQAIINSVNKSWNTPDSESILWLKNLKEFIIKVNSILDGTSPYTPEQPEVFLLDKDDDSYRIVTSYQSLIDRVIISLTSKYFRNELDDYFSESAFAFRKDSSRDHNSAVTKLKMYKEQHAEENLYVAECDIQKFFDCINHESVKSALLYFDTLTKVDNNPLDPMMKKLFITILGSYTFSGAAYPQALKKQEDKKRSQQRTVSNAVLTVDHFYDNLKSESIGLSQGSSLSAVICNMIMDSVDKAVIDGDQDLLYIRYCDDMLILHPDKNKCQQALDRYIAAVERLKLAIHPINKVQYGPKFFNSKSKSPYLWAEHSDDETNSPWVSFLGYQLRCDLNIRIRQTTIHKEKMKLKAIVDNVLHNTNVSDMDRHQVSNIIYKTNCKLIAHGVGLNVFSDRSSNNDISWARAFTLLDHSPQCKKQLKELDKFRELQLSRLRKNAEKETGFIIPQNRAHSDYKFSYYRNVLDDARHNATCHVQETLPCCLAYTLFI